MKAFAIADETDVTGKALAWLFYYEADKRFYIELPDDADPWETPLLLSSVLERGEHTVDARLSKLWVEQRIVPPDRQNLGQILRDNGLRTYDEFQLLVLANGRCAQDEYHLVPIKQSELPKSLRTRFLMKVENVVPLGQRRLLVFFRDGSAKSCDVQQTLTENMGFSPILKDDAVFRKASAQVGGYGVRWGENLEVLYDKLYRCGQPVPLYLDDLRGFVEYGVVNTAEAAEFLGCSRQNIDDLVRRGKLHPIKSSPKNTLFLKSELAQRTWR